MKKRIMAIAFAGCIGLNSVPIFAMGNSESYCPAVQAAQIEVVNERVFIEEACVDIVDEMKPDVLAVLDFAMGNSESYCPAVQAAQIEVVNERVFIEEACVDIVDEMKPDVLAVLDKSAKQQERYDTALAKVKGVQLSEDDLKAQNNKKDMIQL